MSNALALVAQNTGASQEEIKEVLSGMIVSAKNQHGATASNAELAIVTGVAAKYDLNPLVKEMAAFVSGGKLQVTVMIDGWYKMVNRQETFDGVEFEDKFDDKGKITAITCKMFMTNRSRPVTVTEYLAECAKVGKGAEVWTKYPARMLRHKAYIQAARMAFGISEIVDPDEADRIKESEPVTQQAERDITPEKTAINVKSIDQQMAECGDLDTLKQVCTSIRQNLEASGDWAEYKARIIDLNTAHKNRINSYSEVVEDAEFEEVSEMAQKAEALAKETEALSKQIRGDSTIIDAEPDIPFGDDDEEF